MIAVIVKGSFGNEYIYILSIAEIPESGEDRATDEANRESWD